MGKNNPGNYFEDFSIGQVIKHATPRTVSVGDVALYTALYGSRFAVQSSDAFARAIGLERSPVDDLLVFHIVFGKTVADISLNAIANLGYADCRFLKAVYPGDTLSTNSEVIGLKENSNGKTGVVYVRSTGVNQNSEVVLEYVRWVMVRKNNPGSPTNDGVVHDLPDCVPVDVLGEGLAEISRGAYDGDLAGSNYFWGDYEVGEKIDHVDGMTIEETEHMMATRLYQNTAKVHFNLHTEKDGRFGRRIVYGGQVISLARALSFNGLGNCFHLAAINGGRHVAPCFAGDTVYAWSEILQKDELRTRDDVAALRVRTIATKDLSCADFPFKDAENKYRDGVLLDLDYWVILPK